MKFYDYIEWNDTAASGDDTNAGGCELHDCIVRANAYGTIKNGKWVVEF